MVTTKHTKAPLTLDEVNRSRVAREAGTDLAHISRIFSLQSTPSLWLAVRIARSLDITLDELCQLLQIPTTQEEVSQAIKKAG